MKKLFKAFIALCCVGCISMGVLSCAEVKGKSKIQDVTITLNVNGELQDFNFELYLNYAPGTIEHFTYLAKDKNYYNGSAVSNVGSHLEFGSYYFANGDLKSKYDKDDAYASDYYDFITSTYASGKILGYDSELNVEGEFQNNGHPSYLGLNGALVLKRDRGASAEDVDLKRNSGRATMAVTFGGEDKYFTNSHEFAIIGMICTDDADGDVASSYDRLKKLMTDYAKDSDGNVYYYYTLGSDFGNYFMHSAEDSCYYAKDSNGNFTVKIEDDVDVEEDAHELLLEEFTENAIYLNTIPYGDTVITVEKIVFAK